MLPILKRCLLFLLLITNNLLIFAPNIEYKPFKIFTMAKIELLTPKILQWEGGYQCYKEDSGNWFREKLIGTNKGITPATYFTAFGVEPTVEDMKNLTDKQVEQILKKYYWDKWKADLIINQSVAEICVDWVWGSGVWGIKIPQRVLNVSGDGIVGEKTLFAINNYHDQELLFNKIKQARITFIENIIIAKPKNAKFRKGWLRRINSYKFEK